MTKISHLPVELLEEILSRVPMKSMRRVRSICKNWYTLSKDEGFANKHLAQEAATRGGREFQVAIMMDFKVYLMNINLDGIHTEKDVESCIKCQGKLITQLDVSQVYHCDGLLLCLTKDFIRLVVWNPYWGQTRWIQPRTLCDHRIYGLPYAIGYEIRNSRRSYKILSLADYIIGNKHVEIYDLHSQYWRVVDITSHRVNLDLIRCGVSVKGNTYWFVPSTGEMGDSLVCFDFTNERFGSNLPFPFGSDGEEVWSFFSVGGEQFAVLRQRWDELKIEIWITNKIEPNAVSWNKVFLAVDMNPLLPYSFQDGGIFVDEGNKVVVIFGKYIEEQTSKTHNRAYVIGENECFKQVDLGEPTHNPNPCLPFGYSYIPSLVQIKQHY